MCDLNVKINKIVDKVQHREFEKTHSVTMTRGGNMENYKE